VVVPVSVLVSPVSSPASVAGFPPQLARVRPRARERGRAPKIMVRFVSLGCVAVTVMKRSCNEVEPRAYTGCRDQCTQTNLAIGVVALAYRIRFVR
jgi:hypothetical protein